MSVFAQAQVFYHICKAKGISGGARAAGWLTQSGASISLRRLESFLGLRLWDRLNQRPTAEGQELWDILAPAIERFQEFVKKYRGPRDLRIGASEFVLQTYLPAVMDRLRRERSDIGLVFRAGSARDVAGWLERGELDVGLSTLDTVPPKCSADILGQLPLVLLVSRESRIRSAATVLQSKEARFIVSGEKEPIAVAFRDAMTARNQPCNIAQSAGSLALVAWFVRRTNGLGITLPLPGLTEVPGVRALALPDFGRVNVSMIYRESANPLVESFRRAVEQERPNYGEFAAGR